MTAVVIDLTLRTSHHTHMLSHILLFIIVMLMIPVSYLLFFTQTIDCLLLRLKLGKRSESLQNTAEALDANVRSTVADLRKEREAVEQALQTANSIQNRQSAQPTKNVYTHPYMIRLGSSKQCWSATLGWTSRLNADRFSAAEKSTIELPVGGQWYRPRNPLGSPSKKV